MALQLPLKGAKPQGPQPTPDQARQEQCDLWGGCSTPPGTGKTREEPASPAKASCEARAHAATPTARWLARSPGLPAAPWPPRAPSRPGAGREPAPAFLRSFPPSPPGPGLSPASSPGGAGRLFPAESSQRLRPLHRLPRLCSCSRGRQARGRGRQGQGAGGYVTRGGAGEVRPGGWFPAARGTPDFRLGWGSPDELPRRWRAWLSGGRGAEGQTRNPNTEVHVTSGGELSREGPEASRVTESPLPILGYSSTQRTSFSQSPAGMPLKHSI